MADPAPLLQHVWQTQIKDGAGTAIAAGAQTLLGDSQFVEEITVPGLATSVEMDCGSIDKTKIVSVVIVSTKDLVVKTNAADATGGQTINLTANRAFAWNNTMASSNPVTQNITKIFVTNAGAADAKFTASFLLANLA